MTRLDFSLSATSQAYLRWAYQNLEALPGTNSSSPYDGYDTGNVLAWLEANIEIALASHEHGPALRASLERILGESD